ncbi:hypothetical protein LMH73_003660 [Vibrio splendidus]|nr:hypothetical protein [Vibrio splendidus]MCC4883247.1 hypothetical protein [Vibrio splendidus]
MVYTQAQNKAIVANSLFLAQEQLGKDGLSLNSIAKETDIPRSEVKGAINIMKADKVVKHDYDGEGIPILAFTGNAQYIENNPLPNEFSFPEGSILLDVSQNLSGKAVEATLTQPEPKTQTTLKLEPKSKDMPEQSQGRYGDLVKLADAMVNTITENKESENDYFYANQFLKTSNLKGFSLEDVLFVSSALESEGYIAVDNLLDELSDANLYNVGASVETLSEIENSDLENMLTKYAQENPEQAKGILAADAIQPTVTKKAIKAEPIQDKTVTSGNLLTGEFESVLNGIEFSSITELKRKRKRELTPHVIRQFLSEITGKYNKAQLYEMLKGFLSVSMPTFTSWLAETVSLGLIDTSQQGARTTYLVKDRNPSMGLLSHVQTTTEVKLKAYRGKVATPASTAPAAPAAPVSAKPDATDMPSGASEASVDGNKEALGDDFLFRPFSQEVEQESMPTEAEVKPEAPVVEVKPEAPVAPVAPVEPVAKANAAPVQEKPAVASEATTQPVINGSDDLVQLVAMAKEALNGFGASNDAQQIKADALASIERLANYTIEREQECIKWRSAMKAFVEHIS